MKLAKASRLSRRHTENWLRADPYFLGDEAWHHGAPEKANPFKTGTDDFYSWHRGWHDAEV